MGCKGAARRCRDGDRRAENAKLGRPPADVGPNGKPRKTSECPRMLLLVRAGGPGFTAEVIEAGGKPVWRIVDEAVVQFAPKA
jgi:hypothetical protein